MTLVIRHPGSSIMFLKFTASPTETRPIPAGRLVRMVDDREVDTVADASSATQRPVGWLMSKVKDAYTDLPADALFRGDIGSTDVFVGDPVGIMSGPGAVFETDQYVDEGTDGIAAGTLLYCDDDGKLSDNDADSSVDGAQAIALNTLTSTETAAGELLLVKSLL